MRGKREHAAFHFQRGHIFGFKFFRRKIVGLPRIDFRPAREHIDRRKIIFGPGVDRQMRFGDHHHAGDPMRIKRVEDHVDNARFGHLGRFDHNFFNFVYIVQDFGIAVVEFDEEMTSE